MYQKVYKLQEFNRKVAFQGGSRLVLSIHIDRVNTNHKLAHKHIILLMCANGHLMICL